MSRQVANVLYVVAMVALIVGVEHPNVRGRTHPIAEATGERVTAVKK